MEQPNPAKACQLKDLVINDQSGKLISEDHSSMNFENVFAHK